MIKMFTLQEDAETNGYMVILYISHFHFLMFMWSYFTVFLSQPGEIPEAVMERIEAKTEKRFKTLFKPLYEIYKNDNFPDRILDGTPRGSLLTTRSKGKL